MRRVKNLSSKVSLDVFHFIAETPREGIQCQDCTPHSKCGVWAHNRMFSFLAGVLQPVPEGFKAGPDHCSSALVHETGQVAEGCKVHQRVLLLLVSLFNGVQMAQRLLFDVLTPAGGVGVVFDVGADGSQLLIEGRKVMGPQFRMGGSAG